MIFLQKPNSPLAKIFPVAGGKPCYFCKNLSDRMLPFLWQAGSHDSFAKTDRLHAKPFLWQVRAMIFLQKPARLHAILPVAGGEPCYFCKNRHPICYPFCGRREAKIFLQKQATRMLPFMWQAVSHDIFTKTDSPHATLPVAGGEPQYF
jgi:hypothetical protein